MQFMRRRFFHARLRTGTRSLLAALLVLCLPGGANASGFQAQVLALYDAYEAQLARVRQGGWTQVPDGQTLRPGDKHPAVYSLRRRLAASGDAPEATDELIYDEALASAVKGFQQRHGLAADGVVGPASFAALNVSAATRLRQLALNLQRWQAVPIADAPAMVLVNVPEFQARLYRHGEEALSLRAVVGARRSPTPDLAEPLSRIVLNPNWFVPPKIGRRELLPKVVADPEYLARNNYRAFAGSTPLPASAFADPEQLPDTKALRFRQGPGPGNALGQVKFVLPNERGIFLHDTASRELFDRSARAFSHGCVRLENPLALVRTLLENEAGWSPEQVTRQLRSRKTIHLELASELPVYVQYLTARVVDGQVFYFDDIYGRDRAQLAAGAFDRQWVTLLAALRQHQRAAQAGDLLAAQEESVEILAAAL
jgi:murein L,D-transpeptidase YcbB/YkuD